MTMQPPSPECPAPCVHLELEVRNHPGVMSHVCGLFARRAYNLEGILVLPEDHGRESRMWLVVRGTDRLEQIERQLAKLEDVRTVRRRPAPAEEMGRAVGFFGVGGE